MIDLIHLTCSVMAEGLMKITPEKCRLTSVIARICVMILAHNLWNTDLLGATVLSQSRAADTVRMFSREAERVSYSSKGIKRQCVRMRLAPGTKVTEVTVWITGPAGPVGVLELFGHEGGLMAPRIEQRIASPLALNKNTAQRESVTVRFETPVTLVGGQCFISVTDLVGDARLLCSGRESLVECTETNGHNRYSSLQQSSQGQWVFTGYMPWIEVVVEQPASESGAFHRDTIGKPFPTLTSRSQRYLSCFDLLGDGRVDIACAGACRLRSVPRWLSVPWLT